MLFLNLISAKITQENWFHGNLGYPSHRYRNSIGGAKKSSQEHMSMSSPLGPATQPLADLRGGARDASPPGQWRIQDFPEGGA